ncbi:hypothetical protein C8J57DRAFT_1256653 [Mycena rebaudengoi]|nr:hypothetical protein C8J57DRAFT_1256653 [Mycena rebaudengoi]
MPEFENSVFRNFGVKACQESPIHTTKLPATKSAANGSSLLRGADGWRRAAGRAQQYATTDYKKKREMVLKRQSRTGKYDPKRSTKEAFTNTRGRKAVEARRIVVFRANMENGEGGSKREFEEVKLERRKNQMKYTPILQQDRLRVQALPSRRNWSTSSSDAGGLRDGGLGADTRRALGRAARWRRISLWRHVLVLVAAGFGYFWRIQEVAPKIVSQHLEVDQREMVTQELRGRAVRRARRGGSTGSVRRAADPFRRGF